MAQIIIPVAKKICVCDDVIRDPVSGKVSVLNLWDTIRVDDGFPFVLDKLCVFALLRGGLGDIPIHIEIARADNADVSWKSQGFVLAFRDRLKTYETAIKFERAVFPSLGTYVVELYCNYQFVDDQPIRVVSSSS